jgi:uncharacterized peroxidase-related enzyme
MGMIPNLYAVLGHSPKALKADLDLSTTLESASLSGKEVQAIYLAVSEVNGCTYCLSAHTMLGQNVGFSEKEIADLRAAKHADAKLRALTQLAKSLMETKGKPDAKHFDAFHEAGYDKENFMDLVGLVSAKVFSNFVHNALKFPVDFPEGKPLQEKAAV